MKTKLWIAIVAVACLFGYSLGFLVSSKTGVEPGFFDIAESGGYGVTADKAAAQGVSKDVQDYYRDLAK